MIQRNSQQTTRGFTIVELLVVIVVIGILAAITVVSYTGITNRATAATLQSDLDNASKQIKLYYVDHSLYPSSFNSSNCPLDATSAVDSRYCIKSTGGNTITYTSTGSNTHFGLTATGANGVSYYATDNSPPSLVAAVGSFVLALGGTDSDYGTSVTQTTDGGYAVVGYAGSYGAGSGDTFIAKFNSDSVLSWNKTWGGTGNENGNSIVQTSDGGYAITGSTATASFVAGGIDMFIAKYNSSGTLSWSKIWGGAGTDTGSSIVQTSDGGYAVTGSTNTNFGNGTAGDAFLVKYDSDGTLVWNKTWGGAGLDSGASVVQTSDGGYAIAGYAGSYSTSAFLAKYDSGGTLSWNKTWSGSGTDSGLDMAQTTDGGYVITGYTTSFGTGGDMFVIKFDSGGTLSWNKTWGGAGWDNSYAITKTSDGGCVITGSTESYGAGGSDSFLAKYDSGGTLSWSKTWGSTGSDFAESVIQTSDDGYAIIGQTVGYGAGTEDLFVAKYTSSGAIAGCSSPMCQSPSATVTTPSATVSTPSATVTTPSATVSSPTATSTTPSATLTTIVSSQ